jgi:hypothetical protein
MKSKPKKTEEPKETGWTYSAYRATLKKDGKFFAFVTPDGRDCLGPVQIKELLNALNAGRG